MLFDDVHLLREIAEFCGGRETAATLCAWRALCRDEKEYADGAANVVIRHLVIRFGDAKRHRSFKKYGSCKSKPGKPYGISQPYTGMLLQCSSSPIKKLEFIVREAEGRVVRTVNREPAT